MANEPQFQIGQRVQVNTVHTREPAVIADVYHDGASWRYRVDLGNEQGIGGLYSSELATVEPIPDLNDRPALERWLTHD